MNIWAALVLGILIGWLVEWVIDWVYWRNRDARPAMDILQAVDGIGPVISGKLYDAGINTFDALAKLTRPDLEVIVGDEIKNLSDETDIINEAQRLVEIRRDLAK